MAKEQSKAKPDFNVYIVDKREGKDPFWIKVGAAWANKDEKGYSVEFVTPVGLARLVLREPKEEPKSWPRVETLNPTRRFERSGILKPTNMSLFDHGRIACDIRDAYEQIQAQIGAPLANQQQLTAEMKRIIVLIEHWSWHSNQPKALLAQLNQHIGDTERARTAKSIDAHVRAFSTAVLAIINPW
jgi:hypothetical protein